MNQNNYGNIVEQIGWTILYFSTLEHYACEVIARLEGITDKKESLKFIKENLYPKDYSSRKIMKRLESKISDSGEIIEHYRKAKELRDDVAHAYLGSNSEDTGEKVFLLNAAGDEPVNLIEHIEKLRIYRNFVIKRFESIVELEEAEL